MLLPAKGTLLDAIRIQHPIHIGYDDISSH